MKLKFDPSLNYQNDAVKAVVDIFDGQPIAQSSFELSHTTGSLGLTQTELAVGNSITLDDDKLLECIGDHGAERATGPGQKANRRPRQLSGISG